MIREVLGFLSEPIERDDYEEKDEEQEMEMDSVGNDYRRRKETKSKERTNTVWLKVCWTRKEMEVIDLNRILYLPEVRAAHPKKDISNKDLLSAEATARSIFI